MPKIPKIIHYMWMGKEKPEDVKYNISTWKKFCPDYTFMEWNESNFDVNICPFVKDAYANKKYAFVSDFVRVWALKEYGGIWLDTDCELIRPLDDFLDCDDFIGFENEANLEASTFGVIKGSEFINTLYNFYVNRKFTDNKNAMVPNSVMLTVLLHKLYGLKYKNVRQTLSNGMEVFTSDYFIPQNYTTGKLTLTENSYVIHKYASTWLSKWAKFIYYLLRGVRYVFGKRFFGFITRCYVKSLEKSVYKEFDEAVKNK